MLGTLPQIHDDDRLLHQNIIIIRIKDIFIFLEVITNYGVTSHK